MAQTRITKLENKQTQWEHCVNVVLEIAAATGQGRGDAATELVRNFRMFAESLYRAIEEGPPRD